MNIKRITHDARRSGSAIVFAIVLTTLLAILGVLFLLSSRVDSVSTSGVGDNQDLKLAVDSVVAQISEVLTRGVPGVDPNNTYYDYPDNSNPWLASLEPNDSGLWPHVTDLYYQFGLNAYLWPGIIYDHNDTAGNGVAADADGDGVSDSMWVQIPGKVSAKGKPIYAAIRIIDNGGMLNVNTGDKFDPNHSVGSTQLDINLMTLSWRPNNPFFPYNPAAENALLLMRDPFSSGLANYENNVIWQYGLPNGAYTPFDISDELEMRYRFVINQGYTLTRLESWGSFDSNVITYPYDTANGNNEYAWFTHTHNGGSFEPDYAYRHIATTYNCDRIINPAGNKMFNINSPLTFDVNSIYKIVRAALDPNVFSSIDVAQITANLMDYIDGPGYPPTDPRYDPNNNVTVVYDDFNTPHYGFERPCVYISEIAQNFYQPVDDPNVYRSYAIELFKPYWEDDEPSGWKIVTEGLDSEGNPLPPNTTTIVWTGSRRFHVLANINTTVPEANIPIDINEFPGPNDFNGFDANKFNHQPQKADINFAGATYISLWRDVNGTSIKVDEFLVPEVETSGNWMVINTAGDISRSFERDLTLNKCIRKILNPNMTTSPTIGYMNHPFNSGGDMIQAHPANKTFTNIGEIGQLFRTDAYLTNEFSTEASVRLDLADLNIQNLFKYLTVMDPYDHGYTDPNNPETRIKGRININTAPWFVLAQLPWASWTPTEPLNYRLAQAIVAYRDKTLTPSGIDFSARPGLPGFQSIGQLNNVISIADPCSSIGYYAQTGNVFPALTPADGTNDYFEERDAIFTRISNLVTVRSDVFTAYILVRIGPTGPQKRVIATFDRSGVTSTGGKIKVIAIQQVPDPR
jgi:hypothetical protein